MVKFLIADYSEGACPEVMASLQAANDEVNTVYGIDDHCEGASEIIRERIKNPAAQVFFLSGGTQANMIFISHILKGYEAVISPQEGHIARYETGAIQATGHQVIQLPTDKDEKLSPQQVTDAIMEYDFPPHKPHPAMLYISQPTQTGFLYTLEELRQLFGICREHGLCFFIDGARLAMALATPGQPAFAEYSELCDAFTIGGTKCGALFGEALVVNKPVYAENLRYTIKQRGGLFAKGWLLGLQFEALMQGDVYLRNGRNANETARMLVRGLEGLGVEFLAKTPTNQQKVALPKAVVKRLDGYHLNAMDIPGRPDDALITFDTSWRTDERLIGDFLAALGDALG